MAFYHSSYSFVKDGDRSGTMIISRPSGVPSIDSGDSSSMPARTGNNFLLFALWSWRSQAKRQETATPPVETAHSLSSVALPAPPSFSPAAIVPSSLPVPTSDTPSHPTSSSPNIPLDTTAVSSNTLPPRSTSSWSDLLPGSVTSIRCAESSTGA